MIQELSAWMAPFMRMSGERSALRCGEMRNGFLDAMILLS